MSWERCLHVVGKFYADGGTAVGKSSVFTLFGVERDTNPECLLARRNAPDAYASVSYTHLTLPTKLEV